MQHSLDDWSKLSPSDEHIVFLSSVCLYQITTSVDVGYIKFEDYKVFCKRLIKTILAHENLSSWRSFAENFATGDTINNALGKKIIKRSINLLLENKNSPWNHIEWEDIKKILTENDS